jgi:cytochrome P450
MMGNRTATIHRLHQRYGSTVVIGPNEISLSDISNVKELYGQQTSFIKAPVYASLTMPPNGVFSMRDKIQHSQRRRLLSHAFSQSNLQACEPLIHKQVEKLYRVVQDHQGQPLDMLNWFRLTAFDIVGMKGDISDKPALIFPPGELFLGQPFGGLDAGKTPQFLSDIELFFILADLQWNNPWLASFISWIPLPSVRFFCGAMQRLGDVSKLSLR